MKDDIYAGDSAATHVYLAQIAPQKLDVVRHPGEIGLTPRAQIVDHANVVSESDEPLGQMRADEAGPPRDQAV